MEGLTLLGVDKATLKQKAPYIGGGVGALVGYLLMMYTGRRTSLLGYHMSKMTKLGVGSVVGAVAGGAVGYHIKKG